MTRDEFRNSVFERDNHKCVLCGDPAQDAHHIIERRLWTDGGYYLENGASVCGPCHIKCEQTVVSVEDIRYAAGITRIVLPEHMYSDTIYDKWGNIILPNGNRMKGELFTDASIQKVLGNGGVLDLFTDLVKYPRTYHLPWSPGMQSDDRMLKSLDRFVGQRVLVMEKTDGENTSLYPNYIHARSIDGRNHPSRNWVKNFWGQICGDIPEGYHICGENMYAKHSIAYDNLPSYFLGFSMWRGLTCLSWDETQEYFELMGIVTPRIIYDGVWDEQLIRDIKVDTERQEGYVVRVTDEFEYRDFRHVVGKWVRKGHIAPNAHHWFGQPVVPNKLLT